MRALSRFAGSFGMLVLGAAFCVGSTGGAAAAAPKLISGPPCTPQTALGVCFGAPPLPAQLRNIGFNPPSNGTVLVTVNGSGYCVFQDGTVEQTADFETQITDSPATQANHKAAGGLRIKAKQPKTVNGPNPITVPFNLNSSRTFAVTQNQGKNFILAAHAIKFDNHVACYAFGISMSVLFIPN